VTSISQVIRQFKQQWTRQLDDAALEDACRACDVQWRDRLLTPVYTIKLFLLQILWGNTACDHVPRLADRRFTGEAYCKARARLPLAVLQKLLSTCTSAMLAATQGSGLWHGHRLWLVDGTGFSMPDTDELRAHFGQPGGQATGCGFPVAHCLALVHAASGLITELLIAPLRTHDMSLVAKLHQKLAANDLVVGDRGFSSYAHLALLWQRGMMGLMRAHQKLIIDFTPRRPHAVPSNKRTPAERGRPYSRWVKKLGKYDQIVEWFRPQSCPEWMTKEEYAALPESLLVRELRYKVTRRGYRVREVTLVTTLLDVEKYPAEELATLYLRRWRIETNFAHLKTTLGMDVLRCKTVAGVEKEAIMFVLVYNLVRMVMREAAQRQQVDVERISFIDTLRWLLSADADSPLPELIVNPSRTGRYEPRVRKRRPKQFPVMKRPRGELRKALEKAELKA
jgi:hypothetical protein